MTSFALRAVLLVVFSLGLLFAAMFMVILPSLENAILEQKREMIRELTNSAWNILARHEQDAVAGLISREEAKKQAIEQLRSLHYGQQMKDYFWVNDMQPRMIVHPYRTDLEGKDLSNYHDPDGKKIFVEMAEVVKKSGSGYLQYRWQWKDNPDLVVPKISFVKGFEPWGWIIGTGVYIDDVHQEIVAARQKLTIVTLLILLVVLILLGLLLWESITTDQKRLKAEAALQKSEEKYRKIVESSGECLLLQFGRDSLYANQSMLHLMECSWEDLCTMQFGEVFAPTAEEISGGFRYFQRFIQGDPVPAIFETTLKTRSGKIKEVTVSFSRISIRDQQGMVAVANDVSAQRQKDAIQETFLREAQAGTRYWERPAGEIINRNFKIIDETSSIKTLSEAACQYIAVEINNRWHLITAGDILNALNLLDEKAPVKTGSWKSAVVTDENTPVWQIFSLLQNNDYRPVLVTDKQQKPTGIVSTAELSGVSSYSPHVIKSELAAVSTEEELARINKRFFEWVTYLVRSGIKSALINKMVSDNTDLVTQKAVELAMKKLGPAPSKWTFFVLGSAARQEQTLCTDQDNALIYEDVDSPNEPAVKEYFRQLGKEVCTTLAECGYKECDGNFMASNPDWCLNYSAWLNTYEKWLVTSEAQDLLHAKIFFDTRAVTGDELLLSRLMKAVREKLKSHPGFYFLLARNVLLFQPPISFLGNFIADPDVKDREVINIKGVMALITDFARIYALKNEFDINNTSARLIEMHRKELLSNESFSEIEQMFEFLMTARLEHQAMASSTGRMVDNYIEPALLTHFERSSMKEILTQIKNYQVRLSYDFTGSMSQQA
ncbi:MAG: cache domain-containing protein [Candidatus Rifleibacteriota bacterium]